jgi:hypothetical protein
LPDSIAAQRGWVGSILKPVYLLEVLLAREQIKAKPLGLGMRGEGLGPGWGRKEPREQAEKQPEWSDR